MEQNQIPQIVQQASQSSLYTKETDDLLRKYLRMQIGMFYWNIISRLVVFILVVISIITSIYTLAPMMEKLLGPLAQYQELLTGQSINFKENNGGNTLDLNAIIQQLNESQDIK